MALLWYVLPSGEQNLHPSTQKVCICVKYKGESLHSVDEEAVDM